MRGGIEPTFTVLYLLSVCLVKSSGLFLNPMTPAVNLVCYSCTNVTSEGSCTDVTVCGNNEVCAVFRDPTGYIHKCLDADICNKAKAYVNNGCWECCSDSLCNDRCTTDTCSDTNRCRMLVSVGYGVCADLGVATSDCKKTCRHC